MEDGEEAANDWGATTHEWASEQGGDVHHPAVDAGTFSPWHLPDPQWLWEDLAPGASHVAGSDWGGGAPCPPHREPCAAMDGEVREGNRMMLLQSELASVQGDILPSVAARAPAWPAPPLITTARTATGVLGRWAARMR